jgi:hypothetical protein
VSHNCRLWIRLSAVLPSHFNNVNDLTDIDLHDSRRWLQALNKPERETDWLTDILTDWLTLLPLSSEDSERIYTKHKYYKNIITSITKGKCHRCVLYTFIRHIYGNVITHTSILCSIVANSDIKCTKNSGPIEWLKLSGCATRFLIRSSSSRESSMT